MKQILTMALLLAVIMTAVYCSGPQTKTDTANKTDSSKTVYLNQGWSADDRAEYYWAPQGSALLSYDIYLALKDPETKALINSPAMTNQFGFLREPAGHPKNPDELPVGIAKSEVKDGPFKGVYAGLTCAACHTNQINYNGTNIRIDGGNASALQLVPWLKKLSGALDHVQKDESAFKEMVAEIGKKAKVDEADLRKRLNEDVDIAKSWINKILFSKQENGPGRVDAFGGIANAFLGIHTGIFDNITIDRAPVKPPFVWNSSQSAWVEWSGVSPNPLTRNYSEALGVFARYDLTSKGNPANYNISTVDVRWLAQIEQMLRRLAPPQWPQEVLGKIDEAKAARGAKLFTTNCASCHSTYPHRWSEPREQDKRMIENALVPQGYVGTDPANLKSIALDTNAVVETKHLKSIFGGKEKVTPTQFFQVVEGAMMGYSLKKAGFTPEETLDAYGYQSLERLAAAKIPFGRYKAAPRDGSWAIGPFLHNASVPNLYELLSPAKERSQTFYVNSQFDPLKVGISTAATSGVFLFNTKLEGNSNAGHSFENVKGPGVIGRLFTEAERYEIIEFLKSIPTQPGQITPYGGPANPVLAKDDKTWFNNKIPY